MVRWGADGRMGRQPQPWEAAMAHYAGLDVSDKETAIHVVDG